MNENKELKIYIPLNLLKIFNFFKLFHFCSPIMISCKRDMINPAEYSFEDIVSDTTLSVYFPIKSLNSLIFSSSNSFSSSLSPLSPSKLSSSPLSLSPISVSPSSLESFVGYLIFILKLLSDSTTKLGRTTLLSGSNVQNLKVLSNSVNLSYNLKSKI